MVNRRDDKYEELIVQNLIGWLQPALCGHNPGSPTYSDLHSKLYYDERVKNAIDREPHGFMTAPDYCLSTYANRLYGTLEIFKERRLIDGIDFSAVKEYIHDLVNPILKAMDDDPKIKIALGQKSRAIIYEIRRICVEEEGVSSEQNFITNMHKFELTHDGFLKTNASFKAWKSKSDSKSTKPDRGYTVAAKPIEHLANAKSDFLTLQNEPEFSEIVNPKIIINAFNNVSNDITFKILNDLKGAAADMRREKLHSKLSYLTGLIEDHELGYTEGFSIHKHDSDNHEMRETKRNLSNCFSDVALTVRNEKDLPQKFTEAFKACTPVLMPDTKDRGKE